MRNLDVLNCDQGSDAWLKAKLGVISASNISKVLAKKGTEARAGYISELIAQVATGEMPQIDGPTLRWGKEQEQSARSAYEFEKNVIVDKIGFVYGKNRRIGASPDGIITSQQRGLEIKCPFTSKVHVDFLLMDKIKLEYIYQVQFSLFVTGLDVWDFCSYDGRMNKELLKVHTLEKDADLMERFENEVSEFLIELDNGLNKLGIEWGSQWL